MSTQRCAWMAIGLVLTCTGWSVAADERAATAAPFPTASIRFEQNATDGDVEVVFEVSGRKDGLSKLSVHAPDGRPVIEFQASDPSTQGIRQFVFESPEPTDIAGLKVAYPEGLYIFAGTTTSGAALRGEARLGHQLPATTSFVSPTEDADDVPTSALTISWAPVPGVAGYIVELEQDDMQLNITATLPAAATSLQVPKGLLRPGLEYALGIGTVGKDGNVSYVETSFTTAAE